MHEHRGVDPGAEQRHAPDRLAGPRVGAHHAPVTRAREEHAPALVPAKLGMRKRIVFRRCPRARRPDQRAGLLVERVEPIRPRALRAPVGGDAAGDHQVGVDDGRSRAAVRKRQPAELLHQRMLPEQRAVRRKRRQDALRALDIDVARLAIDRRAGRGIAQVDGVAQVIVVEMLPELPARLRVETGHALLQIRPLAGIAHGIQLSVRDHGCRLPGEIRPPERVPGRNAVRETGLRRIAALLGSPPAQPAARRSRRSGQWRPGRQYTAYQPHNSGGREGSRPPTSNHHLKQHSTKHFAQPNHDGVIEPHGTMHHDR